MPLLHYNSVVTTPAASKDMTVLATVKAEMGFTTVDAARDALLAVLIQQASSKAVELSGREFATETLTEYFRIVKSDPVLQLDRRPIESITSVVEDGVTLAGTDYEIIARNGWLQRVDADAVPICWTFGKVVVVYRAGYDMLTELSHALERIVIDEVKRQWFVRNTNPSLKGLEVPGVLRQDFWVSSGGGAGTGTKDPMLAALEAARFVDIIGP